MARPSTVRRPASSTTKPDVDEKEPLKNDQQNEEGQTDEAEDTGDGAADENADAKASTRSQDGPGVKKATRGAPSEDEGDDKQGDERRSITEQSSEPNVASGGGDGVTYQPAVGTSRDAVARGLYSTKEGDAPIGQERDVGGGAPNATGPSSQMEAALSGSMAPAGTVIARQQIGDVTEQVGNVIRDFAANTDDVNLAPTANIHDDIGVQRAHVVHLAAKLEEEFGIDITPSEAQNFLLVRDITNLVLRKLAKQG